MKKLFIIPLVLILSFSLLACASPNNVTLKQTSDVKTADTKYGEIDKVNALPYSDDESGSEQSLNWIIVNKVDKKK